MASRLELHELLCSILNNRNVYFQPPESLKISYPAIIYSLNDIDPVFADNKKYSKNKSYQAILIDEDPDSVYVDALEDLSFCRFDRHYVSDNLNHFTFTLYY